MSEASKRPEKTPRRGSPRTVTGRVVSHGRDKSIKVVVGTMTQHPLYGKYVRHRTVCHAHDERNEAMTGDMVEIMECRPMSKTKHWRLIKVVTKGLVSEAAPTGAKG